MKQKLNRTYGVGGLGAGDIILVRLRLSVAEQIFELSADGVSNFDDLGEFTLKGGQPSGRRGIVVSTAAGGLEGIAFPEEAPDVRSLLAEPSAEILNPFLSGEDSEPGGNLRGIDGVD